MSEYTRKMTQELFEKTAEDLPRIAGVLSGGPLEEAVCAFLGMTPERLKEIADGADASRLERVGLYTAAEYLTYPLLYPRSAYPSYGFPQTRTGIHPLDCDVLKGLLDEHGLPLAVTLRDRWMSGVMDLMCREADFFGAMIYRSGEKDETDFFKNYHFFMDGSALCSEYMPAFLDHYLAKAAAPDVATQVIVPQMVVTRIEEMAENQPKEDFPLIDAISGRNQMDRLQDAGALSVRGDKGESALISTFISALARYKPTYRIALLTQDQTLANAIHFLNKSGVEGHEILIAFLEDGGYPALWFSDGDGEEGKKPVRGSLGKISHVSDLERSFHMARDEDTAQEDEDSAETKIAVIGGTLTPPEESAEDSPDIRIADAQDAAPAPKEEDGEESEEEEEEYEEEEEESDEEDYEEEEESDEEESGEYGEENKSELARDRMEEELLAAIGQLTPAPVSEPPAPKDISKLRLEPADDEASNPDVWQGLP